jgi:hypothetical protein
MTLEEIKRLVAAGQYRFSSKVFEFLTEGYYDLEDLVHCIVSATEIYKTERDERRESVHEMKYTILGRDTCGLAFYTVGKVVRGSNGRYYFFITAHAADEDS